MVITLDLRNGKMISLHWNLDEMNRFEQEYRDWLDTGKPFGEFRHLEIMENGEVISCIAFHEITGRRITGKPDEVNALYNLRR